MRPSLRDIPIRLAAGAFVLHSGWEKLHGTEEQAQALHGMGAGGFPFLRKIPPATFLKALAATEVGIGAALLAPVVPNELAGASLTAFAAALVTLYLRTPALHKANSVWPTPAGIAVAKDVWLLGIGLGLLAAHADER
jgi:uncharacterized membrane protein YphA (DoxX/SURF4 family)